MTLPNPECPLCGKPLNQHRHSNRSAVYCLELKPRREWPRDAAFFKVGYETDDPGMVQRRFMTCPLSILVKSPLSGTDAADAWVDATLGTSQTSEQPEMFPGMENVR